VLDNKLKDLATKLCANTNTLNRDELKVQKKSKSSINILNDRSLPKN